jgi:membrane protease YdiL (CAAX protease family)
VTAVMATLTGLILFRPCRRGISYVLSAANDIISGQLLYGMYCLKNIPNPVPVPVAVEHKPVEPAEAAEGAEGEVVAAAVAEPGHGVQTIVREPSLVATAAPLIGARSWKDYWLVDRVFVPDSLPHLNGMWIYITVLGSLLANMNLENFAAPMIGIPFPVPLDSLFSYNFLGLILLAIAGCGIIVARRPGEVMTRLGLVKPKGWHIGVALLMVLVTFGYDLIWSYFTGSTGVGGKLSMYNAGTFAAAGGNPGPAAFLALATGICAGAGEEVLMRGALQPVFGIIPAAILHGTLHGQFQHAPILIVQVAGWSCLMGIVRRYTNTTTTLITHALFNFITTFLFAFNP